MNTDLRFFKPKIIISRCFLEPVRYNGEIIRDDFVERLKEHVEFIDMCPEVDIGLGIPRKRLILIERNKSKRLIQPETNRDLTEKMQNYLKRKVCKIKDVDGILLKSKSPSCGVSNARLHDKGGNLIGKTDGMFAELIRQKFPHLPLEDEKRLKDYEIKHHFLVRIFAFSELRNLKDNSINDLIDFHLKHKYLLMTYNQKMLRELGRLVADSKIGLKEKLIRYKALFYDAFQKKPTVGRHYNTLLHIMGYFLTDIPKKEKKHLIGLVEKYKKGLVNLELVIEFFKEIISEFRIIYLLRQRYMNPFPEEIKNLIK